MDSPRFWWPSLTRAVVGLLLLALVAAPTVRGGCSTTNAATGLCTSCDSGYYGSTCTSTALRRPAQLLTLPAWGVCVGVGALVIASWVIVAWAYTRADEGIWEEEEEALEADESKKAATATSSAAVDGEAPAESQAGEASQLDRSSGAAAADAAGPHERSGEANESQHQPTSVTGDSAATATAGAESSQVDERQRASEGGQTTLARSQAPPNDEKLPTTRARSASEGGMKIRRRPSSRPRSLTTSQRTSSAALDASVADEPVADTAPEAPNESTEAKSAETKSAESKPAEEQPAEAKPAEEQPAEAKPAEANPAEEQPAEAKPAEANPAEEQPAEAMPAEEQPAEAKPAEEQPAEAKPAEANPAEAKPAEVTPIQSNSESKPAEPHPSRHRTPVHDSIGLSTQPLPLPRLQSHVVPEVRDASSRRKEDEMWFRRNAAHRSNSATPRNEVWTSGPSRRESEPVAERGSVRSQSYATQSRAERSPSGDRAGSRRGVGSLPAAVDDGPLPPLFEAGDVLVRTPRFPLFAIDVGGAVGVVEPGSFCVVELIEVDCDASGRYAFSYHFVGGQHAVDQRRVELHFSRVSRDGARVFEFDDPNAVGRASSRPTPRGR